MRNLSVPTTENLKKLTSIINSKHKPYKARLIRVRPRVKSRYVEYDIHSNKLENLAISTISGVEAEALKKCYTSSTKEMSALRDEILYPDLEDFDECPFCGIGEPTTLDHYFPKEYFPEFSVLAKNLIPVCNVCNSSYKGLKYIENGERLFIHTYFDIFPDDYLFEATITVNDKISINFLTKTVMGNLYFSQLFNRHFESLALNKRYKRKSASEISRKRHALERIFKRNNLPADVAAHLLKEAIKLEHEHSKIYWKAVLYRGLSKSIDFCNGGFRKPLAS